MGRHRGTPGRPRYGRIATLAASLAVTLVAVLGGIGALPDEPSAADVTAAEVAHDPEATSPPAAEAGAREEEASSRSAAATGSEQTAVDPREDTTLPAGTGRGKRVVFSQSRQRVWLVEGRKKVVRTYLVSGSVEDNLDPGTYAVYSRSEQAYGIDDSGTMKYFVRFTQGERAAIGFHDIPIDDGEKVQTVAELGTPQSHGCIRQRRADAIALWDFAPLGTTVVVTA
ncbi:L,D-transpeptidase family protein [Nocardioides sp. zg-579]|uniref:L,D-transpeptidase family protein n=1 Tax=Nocardioides marmotae TaxID=2663857 RepID=A0A6I3J6H0_9ACTN|nr:L,D-transpeptidase [Nocardioides marmotae]MCR6031495.1 L,D-transpeptidase family protein [Gordonia jinghuaiqii]MTB95134.1 L,D-transpeptidase family protein [Nocardioides marmotae]QKE02378.1 L,D-transpeptidase [Nocardioides marmotae]